MGKICLIMKFVWNYRYTAYNHVFTIIFIKRLTKIKDSSRLKIIPRHIHPKFVAVEATFIALFLRISSPTLLIGMCNRAHKYIIGPRWAQIY